MNKNLIILSIAVAAVLIGGYNLLSGLKPGGQNNTLAGNTAAVVVGSNQQNQVMFSVDAKRWQFTPDTIRVKKGQKVKIIINNTDTVHGINLPDFSISGDDTAEFTADKTGEFTFYCKNFCGEGHAGMTGKVVVTE